MAHRHWQQSTPWPWGKIDLPAGRGPGRKSRMVQGVEPALPRAPARDFMCSEPGRDHV